MIQQVCPKRDNRCVAIKWTAIPITLLESERFRYEQGAITGAVAQTVGRFLSRLRAGKKTIRTLKSTT
jgi:transcriptional regulator with GAF, ATPase, and Fis domain